jgi:hypothetical protein
VAFSYVLAMEQLHRFENHPPKFPDEAGRLELLRAFEQVADTDAQVRDIIEELLRTCQFCPVPADIYAAADFIAERKRCEGTPTPYDGPGGDIDLSEHMEPELIAKFEQLARSLKDSRKRTDIAKRNTALGILEGVYRHNPSRRPEEPL